jgi:hypothetical protein
MTISDGKRRRFRVSEKDWISDDLWSGGTQKADEEPEAEVDKKAEIDSVGVA